MFVGEAPGREEDIEGLPFVGRSGKLLDLMMAAIGLDRTTAYIANIIPWRPPGNRTPTPQESQICLPFIAAPDRARRTRTCWSASAARRADAARRQGRHQAHARTLVPFHTGTREIRAIATFHPAYLLRSPLEKRFAWRDFLAIQKALRRGLTALSGEPSGTYVLEESCCRSASDGLRSRPARPPAVRLHDLVSHHLPELHHRACRLHRDAAA